MRLIYALIALVSMASVARADQPNVIVFLVDDMGVMDSSVPFLTGGNEAPKAFPLNELYRTPNMQRLAERGVRFSTFYAMSVCSPSRVSMLTGQNATRHGTTQWINPASNNRGKFGPADWNWTGLDSQSVTLPGLLRDAGYRTIHVGKAHFGPRDHEGADPTNLGFDVNIGGGPQGQPGSYYAQDHYGFKKGSKPHAVDDLEAYHDTGTYLSEALTLEAIKQIDAAVDEGKPFFLNMAHYAVHAPFQIDPRFAEHYEDGKLSPDVLAFATMIEGIDKSLGDLMDHLDERDIAGETLIFFLGDNGTDARHGPVFSRKPAEPLRAMKGTCYEGGLRVPFIAAWAGKDGGTLQANHPIPGGPVQSQMGAIYDLFPTILEAANVEVPAGHVVDGASLWPQLSGERGEREARFLMHFPHGHRSSYFTSLRLGGLKLIYHYEPESGEPRVELFDLSADPFEERNLSGEEPEKVAMMIEAMDAQLRAEGAKMPVDADGNEMRPNVPEAANR